MPTTSSGRVLIIDDEEDMAVSLDKMLARQGYQTSTFTSARQALEAIGNDRFDLLLTDLKMPEMDGIELLRAALSADPSLVGIVMTGQATIETAVETMKAGALDYIVKPFRAAALTPVLARAMEVHRLRRRARELTDENLALSRQLSAELARAGLVQAELLPASAPRLPGFELAARCLPAREVGGDFYDWQEPSANGFPLTVGDVMGKGMPAALLMATMRASLRAVALQNPPARALDLVREAMADDLERTGSFVTLFHARLDVPARCLRYVDAGHGHLFILRSDGEVELLVGGGPPLGVSDRPYNEGLAVLRAGDSLVVYSDGLVEACPEAPLDRRTVAEQLRHAPSASAMVERLVDFVVPRRNTLADDLTVVVLRCQFSASI